jgi:hypothetical protein
MMVKCENLFIHYQKKLIRNYLMVICGFQSFLNYLQHNLVVFNDVLAVWCDAS